MNPCSISTCEDVLIEILSRLPPKSLVRFTSVCRFWKSIISSPQFRLSSNRPTRLLVHTDRECYTLVEGDINVAAAHHKLVFEADFPQRHRSNYESAGVIIGSDNGLICISIDYCSPCGGVCPRFIIWNPCVRRHVVVPDHPGGYSTSYSTGFGATTNGLDHKIVRIVGYTVTVDETTQKAFHIRSLKSGTWRVFCLDYVSYLNRSFSRIPALLKGRLHWVVSESGSKFPNCISTLGLEDEVFVDYAMMLPEQISDSQQFMQDVTVVKESLAAVAVATDAWKSCSLWVMQEYGDVGSWVKLCSIDQSNTAVGSFDLFRKNKVHVLDNGDVLLGFHESWPSYCQKFVTCDPKTMKTKDFGWGTGVFLWPSQVCGFTNYYKESLVLLADEDRAVPDHKNVPYHTIQGEFGYFHVWL